MPSGIYMLGINKALLFLSVLCRLCSLLPVKIIGPEVLPLLTSSLLPEEYIFCDRDLMHAVADLGEGPGAPPPLILGKKGRNDLRENGQPGK